MYRILITGFLLFTAFQTSAQFLFEFNDAVPVVRVGDTLGLAWAGGLNNPQFSDMDVDYDGDEDLVIFDRSSDQILVFKQENGPTGPYYHYWQEGAKHFPSDAKYRATCVDYDQDGREDLFTYGTSGIKVYRNTGSLSGGMSWELASELLLSDYWGFVNTLYVSSNDIPAIVDVDADGDIDVLTFHIGGEYMQYHKNQSMELYGIPDSLVFELRNECWGGFREDLTTSFIYLNWNDSPCVTGNVPGAELNGHDGTTIVQEKAAHAGSTVLAIDVDGSGVMDLVIGDIAYPTMHLLTNGGSSPNTNSLMVSDDASFPSNSLPVSMSLFPAAYYVDVDFDGIRDLLIAPNAKGVSQDEQSVWRYANNGSNANPLFGYQEDDFLQNEMIDHGTAALPVLVDLNQDGLQDLVVSVFHRFEAVGSTRSQLAYYRNTGTSTDPVFTLIDDDLLNLSQENLGLHLVPTFADLDNDGDPDMLIGRENGSLAYYENTSVLPAIGFSAPQMNYPDATANPISSGQFAAPQLIDLNEDGLIDLVVGGKTGELQYFENTGTVTNPSFTLQNSLLGMIDLTPTGSDGYAVPHFFRWENELYLLLGAADGKMRLYTDISDNLSTGSSFQLEETDFLSIHSGAYSSFFTGDIDMDGNLNLFAGNDLGGIRHFEHNPNSDLGFQVLPAPEQIHVYPNPVTDQLVIEVDTDGTYSYAIYDVWGRVVVQETFSGKKANCTVSDLGPGSYFIRLEGNGTSGIGKFVKYGE